MSEVDIKPMIKMFAHKGAVQLCREDTCIGLLDQNIPFKTGFDKIKAKERSAVGQEI